MMKFFDLHCDTLFRALEEKSSLNNNDFHVSIDKGNKFLNWVQCFAVFIPDEYRNQAALDLFNRAFEKLNFEIEKSNGKIVLCKNSDDFDFKNNVCNAILTVEGGAILGGNLSNLDYLHSLGVKMMTLTWNGKNEIGDGCGVKFPSKITDFGKKVLKRMESLDMIIDVSHASDNLFFDVFENTKKPFAASHSNSRKICNHRRNLTDEQFKYIKERQGIVGLNFCKDFLSSSRPCMYDVIRHTEHFLSLGGENVISIGADFDGADMPVDIFGMQSIESLYELFLKEGYSETLLQKIFFENAYNFFMKNCFN